MLPLGLDAPITFATLLYFHFLSASLPELPERQGEPIINILFYCLPPASLTLTDDLTSTESQSASTFEAALIGPRFFDERIGQHTPTPLTLISTNKQEILTNTKNSSIAIEYLIRGGQLTGAPIAEDRKIQSITNEEEAELQVGLLHPHTIDLTVVAGELKSY
ncbi:unnamed protein product [Rhizoctonia solani]|uniref:Uncharacterized protein n=1 Tax=Rhizoctonia solani TaxID=456999 RepID=A0A8H3B1L7_9AGAM|nr:unnamed protein product [Rhizoctonia solani]